MAKNKQGQLVRDRKYASAAEIERAREEYARGSDDNIEIDDNAEVSVGRDGIWVQAWVWLADDDE